MVPELMISPVFRLAMRLLVPLACLFLTTGSASAQGVLERLVENGPAEQRINIVFVSEGYRAPELSNFSRDATRILTEILSTSPYKAYSTYFNAFALAVASSESGSDHPSRGQYRDTYFDSYYDCSGITRLICVGGDGHTRLQNLLQEHMPSYDIVVLVVNDEEYGGSGGHFSVTSINDAAAEIAIHEIGHSFVWLTDEYGGGELGSGEYANATQETRRDHIRWGHWILPTTPLPTPSDAAYRDVVGLFEGAAYADFGWYRPQQECKMRSLGVPFCSVCREHHIRAIYNLVSPIAGYAPLTNRLIVPQSEAVRLSVDPMTPTEHDLRLQWFVDGTPIDGAVGLDYTMEATGLPEDGAVVSVRVWDDTREVADPAILLSGVLEASVAWEIVPSGATGVDDGVPMPDFSLAQNFPNPVRTSTIFSFRLDEHAPVTLQVFDPLGRLIDTVLSESRPAGRHEIRWSVPVLAPGIYFYHLQANGRQAVRKMTVLPQ